MDRIPASKFMKVHYMSLKRTIIFNTLILIASSIVVLLVMRIWMLEISRVVFTIYIFIVVMCILSSFIVFVDKIAHTHTLAARFICLISNVWSIVPTPAAIRVCVVMTLLTSVIPYATLVLLRIYNGTQYSNNAKDADAKNEEQSASSNSDAASISYGVFMFYVLMMLVMITSLHFAGGIFPNVWWFVTGSTDKNVGGKFTIFLFISLLLSGLMTMSPPPKESSSSREGSDTASILEGVLRSSCVNNVIIGLITGIAFCTVA